MTPQTEPLNDAAPDHQASVPTAVGAGRSGVMIRHERPAPETEPHVIAPLIVSLHDGRRLTARKWSLAGIRDKVLEGEDLTGARLMIPFQGVEVGFPVRFSAAAEGPVWAFDGLTGRQREVLGLFYRNLMVGKMAATDEVITALDTPVDLIPMGETAEEKSAGRAKAKPRALRAVLNVMWYVALFLAVTGFLGTLVWGHVEGIDLSHSRVFAQRIDLRATRDGYLQQQVPAGRQVADGTQLARLVDPQIETGITHLEQRVRELQARADQGRARLAQHMSQLDLVRAAMQRLMSPNAMARFDAGIPLKPGDFNDTRARLENELRGFENDLDAAMGDLGVLRSERLTMQIAAPGRGMVPEWTAAQGQFMYAGDVIASYETDSARVVRGWLDDRLANSVKPGMDAEVQVVDANGERVLPGKVVDVEAGVDPQQPDQFGIVATIALTELSADQTRAELPFNEPVEITIKRDLLDRLLGRHH